MSTPPPTDPRRWAACLAVASRCIARVRRPEYGAVLHAAARQHAADTAAQAQARMHGRGR